MKKIFVFAFLLLSSFSLFAFDKANWLVNTDLGLGVPLSIVELIAAPSSESKPVHSKGITFDCKSQLIHKSNGLTFQAGLSLGGICVNDFYVKEDIWGFDFNSELGIGYSFIRNKKIVLSLAGVFGCDCSCSSILQTVFFLGPDISVTYRISNIIGLYGSFLFGVPVFGFGSINEGRENVKAGFFYIKPSIGVSITVD